MDQLPHDPEVAEAATDQSTPMAQRPPRRSPAGEARTRRIRAALTAFASATAVLGVALALNATGMFGRSDDQASGKNAATPPSTTATAGYDGLPVVEPGEPCPIATRLPTDLALVRNLTAVPIFAPVGTISRAWRCGDTPVLMYGDIQVSYESGWSGVDIAAKWSDLAADYGGTIETIAGQPALVQPSTDEGSRNQVMIVVGDTLIRFLAADGAEITELTSLAQTLQFQGELP